MYHFPRPHLSFFICPTARHIIPPSLLVRKVVVSAAPVADSRPTDLRQLGDVFEREVPGCGVHLRYLLVELDDVVCLGDDRGRGTCGRCVAVLRQVDLGCSEPQALRELNPVGIHGCLLYTSDAADE